MWKFQNFLPFRFYAKSTLVILMPLKLTLWKNEKFFPTEKIFREINSLASNFLVKTLLARVGENYNRFHNVKLSFWPFLQLSILNFWKFLTSSSVKYTKNQNSGPLKLSKKQFLTFWNQTNRFHIISDLISPFSIVLDERISLCPL